MTTPDSKLEFVDGYALLQNEKIGERRFQLLVARLGMKAEAISSLVAAIQAGEDGFGAITYDDNGEIDTYDMDWLEATIESVADMEKELLEGIASVRRLRYNLDMTHDEGVVHNRNKELQESAGAAA